MARPAARRWTRPLLALLALLATSAPARAADGTIEVVGARADQFPRVAARFNATADGGAPLAGLRPEDLRVVEDGRPVRPAELLQLRDPALPASIVLAVDVGRVILEQNLVPPLRDAVKAYADQSRRLDRLGLVTFGSAVAIDQPPTTDRALLGRAADRAQPSRGSRLHDGLVRAVTEAAAVEGGTRAVVLLSGGQDSGSTGDVAEGIGLARRFGVPVFTIAVGPRAEPDGLERIAIETGGQSYRALGPNDVAQTARLVARLVASQYELSWLSQAPATPGRDVPIEIGLEGSRLPGAGARSAYRVPVGLAAAEPPAPNVGGQSRPALPTPARPSDAAVLIAGVLAGLGVGLVYAWFVLRTFNRRVRTRLADYVRGVPVQDEATFSRASPGPVMAVAARFGSRLVPTARLQRFRESLTQAGLYADRHLQYLLAAKLILAAALGLVGYLLLGLIGGGLRALPIALVMAVIGFYLPNAWLGQRIKARQRAIVRALPDALDLLSIGVTAGLSFDGSVLELVQKWDNELSQEFALVLREMNIGTGRREALQNLAQRTQIDDIRLLVAALIQSDELGTSLGDTLTVQAEQLRLRRRQRAQEQAQQAVIKMLIPMVFLIFPALFVVILGPAVPQLLEALGGAAP